jgi:hypothetical protein
MFDTLMARIPQKWKPVLRKNARDVDVRGRKRKIDAKNRWSGRSSNIGGTDGADIISSAIFGKPEMPDLRGSKAKAGLNNAGLLLNNC